MSRLDPAGVPAAVVIPQYSVEDHAWQVAAREALDYAAIAALLEGS